MVAHVWPASQDPSAYTHLANLAIVPESFGGLTDKDGPLASYLRYHAYATYGWKPSPVAVPNKPDGFDSIAFNYLPVHSDPKAAIALRVSNLNNDRLRTLRPLMGLQSD